MRIGFFTDTYFPQVSGVSTSIRTLKEELEAIGHEVIIFTTTDPKAQVEKEAHIVRLPSIPFLSCKGRRIALKGFRKALKEAKESQIDIVHTHTEFSMGLMGKYVARKMGVPNIHTYHTMYEKYLHYFANGKVLKPKNVQTISRLFCNRTTGIIAPSQITKELLMSYGINQEIRVIPTGVPLPEKHPDTKRKMRQQLGLKETDLVLLSLSRLAYEKNLDKILNAFPCVLKTYPNSRLVFVGDGPARSVLENQAFELGVSEAVLFTGEADNDGIHSYYQMADFYLNASESETQGLTFLESMVNGCPIVAKRNAYLEEVIQKPQLGTLYDQYHEFEDCIINTIERLQQNSPDHAAVLPVLSMEEFSSAVFGENVLSFYQDAIARYSLNMKKSGQSNPRIYSRIFKKEQKGVNKCGTSIEKMD